MKQFGQFIGVSLCVSMIMASATVVAQDVPNPAASLQPSGTPEPTGLSEVDQLITRMPSYLEADTAVVRTHTRLSVLLLLISGSALAVLMSRFRRLPMAMRITLAIVGVLPLIFSIVFLARRGSVLHSSSLVREVANRNTDPDIVLPGMAVYVRMDTDKRIESTNGLYEFLKSRLRYQMTAHTVDGKTVTLEPALLLGDSNPQQRRSVNAVDAKPEAISPRLPFRIPANPELERAQITVVADGDLVIYRGGFGNGLADAYYGPFSASASFRIATEQELNLCLRVKALSKVPWTLFWIALALCLLSIGTLIVGTLLEEEAKAAPKGAEAAKES